MGPGRLGVVTIFVYLVVWNNFCSLHFSLVAKDEENGNWLFSPSPSKAPLGLGVITTFIYTVSMLTFKSTLSEFHWTCGRSITYVLEARGSLKQDFTETKISRQYLVGKKWG